MLENDGYELVRGFDDDVRSLTTDLKTLVGPGARDALLSRAVAAFAYATHVRALVRRHVDGEPFPVRGIVFNKTADTSWAVPWHQDLNIAVRERVDVSGFGPWTVKAGVTHVQAPLSVLERMLTLRLHLDDATEENGALRVVPGSHRLGLLDPTRIEALRRGGREHLCAAKSGDVLLMRPLLLHASSKGTAPSARRVLHLEYASFELPGGLRWSEVNEPDASPPR